MLRIAFIFLLAAGPASAHEATGQAQWAETGISGGLVVIFAAIYGAGLRRLWLRAGSGRGVGPGRPLAFGTGFVLLSALLLSPLDSLAEQALSAHMVQHFGLMLLAAPLIVLGRPGFVALWILPAVARPALLRLASMHFGPAWRVLTHPVGAWLVYLIALWSWHAPPLHEAALNSHWIHAAQHASFIAAALIFWTAVLEPVRPELRAGAFLAVFATAVHSCALAALITTSAMVWYPAYGPGPHLFGLTLLADQRLGGLIMWAPCSALLVGGALATLARLLRDIEARSARSAH